jgi:hypothetical protein
MGECGWRRDCEPLSMAFTDSAVSLLLVVLGTAKKTFSCGTQAERLTDLLNSSA